MNRILDFDECDGEPQVSVEPAVRHDDLLSPDVMFSGRALTDDLRTM